ncbi:MAG: glycoside hydrolase family 3 C-terminal domain-containing protein, partial [Clostridia bacterium]|nr:glycoside hydrolase family 3 C-terminal domain-containing protein [Clostridia bacterium]
KGLIDVLRGEFGFDGFVMSDWGTIIDRVTMLNAGNDMYCGGAAVAEQIISQIQTGLSNGRLEMSQLDKCCENILNYVAKSNAMKNISVTNTISDRSQKLQAIRTAGAEGTVLLKNNNNTLPLPVTTVSLFGNASYKTEYCGYGAGYVSVKDVVNISEGLQNSGIVLNSTVSALYNNCVQHDAYSDSTNPENDTCEIVISSSTARAAAKVSEYAIFTISRTTRETMDHANRAGDYMLNARERQAIENISSAFHAQGKKFIVIINTGNPIEVASWAHLADAIVYAGLSGEQIGNSVADIIRGKVTPSGKLTSTWPVKFSDTPYADYFPGDYNSCVYNDDIYVGYRYFTTFNVDVMYEFGYGLSYTTFEYSDFKVEKSGDDYILSVNVTNTGKVSGSEVVQFYVTKPDNKNEHPVKELAGYGKTVTLAPGASQTITVKVTKEELKTYSTDDSAWFIEQGEYKFHVGASVEKIHFTDSVVIGEETTVLDTENILKDTSAIAIITKDRPSFDFNSSKNIALNKPLAKSGEESGCPVTNVTDGKLNTRWSAAGSTTATYWVTIDLQKVQHVKEAIIVWEANSHGEFTVNVSTDNKNWEELGPFDHAQANLISIDKDIRYINIQGPKNAYFSIYEIGVYQ